MEKSGRINKRDLILVFCVLCAAAAIYIGMQIFAGEEGAYIVITVDGEEYGTYPLDEDAIIEVASSEGTNTVVISGGYAYMQEADCPDGYCIDQGKINKSNQTIVCLPHKLVVSVVGGEESDVDAIAQ